MDSSGLMPLMWGIGNLEHSSSSWNLPWSASGSRLKWFLLRSCTDSDSSDGVYDFSCMSSCCLWLFSSSTMLIFKWRGGQWLKTTLNISITLWSYASICFSGKVAPFLGTTQNNWPKIWETNFSTLLWAWDQKAQVRGRAQRLLESTFHVLKANIKYLQLIERVWSDSTLPVIEGNGHPMSRHPAKGWISSSANLTGKEKFSGHRSLISFHYSTGHSVGTDSWFKTSEHTEDIIMKPHITGFKAGPFFSPAHAF